MKGGFVMKETAAFKHFDKKWVFLVIGILFVAANLRPSLTAVGPVLGFIREDLGLSHSVAGLLSTLPLMAFFVFPHWFLNFLGSLEWNARSFSACCY